MMKISEYINILVIIYFSDYSSFTKLNLPQPQNTLLLKQKLPIKNWMHALNDEDVKSITNPIFWSYFTKIQCLK